MKEPAYQHIYIYSIFPFVKLSRKFHLDMRVPKVFLLLCLVQLSYCIITTCTKNYYTVLGLDQKASIMEIKKAFRTLSKQYHPDKNPGKQDEYTTKFVEVFEAYAILSSSETRQLYDKYGQEGLRPFCVHR